MCKQKNPFLGRGNARVKVRVALSATSSRTCVLPKISWSKGLLNAG